MTLYWLVFVLFHCFLCARSEFVALCLFAFCISWRHDVVLASHRFVSFFELSSWCRVVSVLVLVGVMVLCWFVVALFHCFGFA